MTTNNQIPVSDTATMPQVSNPTNSISDEDLEAFIDACKGQPTSLEKSQVFKFDEWLDESGMVRRAALFVATKPYDELEKNVLNDRDFAVAMADVEEGLKLMLDIVMQSRHWILAALSVRPDCDEIIAEADNDEENENAAQSHCSSVDDSDKNASKKGTYETVMAAHIKAIQPKFKALYDKYIFPGGGQLLTDPKSLGTETKALRNEIWELQNQMPVESEEGMD